MISKFCRNLPYGEISRTVDLVDVVDRRRKNPLQRAVTRTRGVLAPNGSYTRMNGTDYPVDASLIFASPADKSEPLYDQVNLYD